MWWRCKSKYIVHVADAFMPILLYTPAYSSLSQNETNMYQARPVAVTPFGANQQAKVIPQLSSTDVCPGIDGQKRYVGTQL